MCNELENLISNSDDENLVCNLEMSNEDVIERMIIKSSKRDIDYHTDTKFQSTEYKTACKKIQTNIQKIHFYENLSNPKGTFVANKVRKLLVKHPNIKNVFLDHMEELSFDTAIKREDIAIGQNYKLFKSIAKEFNVRMFLFTQLNRGIEDRKDKRPIKSDIKNTGVAEEIADKIILLYNKNMYKDKHILKVEEEFIIDKNRKGATGTALCSYIKNIHSFTSIGKEPMLLTPTPT